MHQGPPRLGHRGRMGDAMKRLMLIVPILMVASAAAYADEDIIQPGDLTFVSHADTSEWARWNSAGSAWSQWNWEAGNAWNTGSELDVVPSPDGRFAAA